MKQILRLRAIGNRGGKDVNSLVHAAFANDPRAEQPPGCSVGNRLNRHLLAAEVFRLVRFGVVAKDDVIARLARFAFAQPCLPDGESQHAEDARAERAAVAQ
ncbi:hypothetical protein SDC9_194465 [bioreactor metagenome]|uniref:Uncharacterized protein n=1 Tax=bioreactor metagenome TaxID=1076179 RepID=A0A645I7J7_9ZZZZ